MELKILGIVLLILLVYKTSRCKLKFKKKLRKTLSYPEVTYISKNILPEKIENSSLNSEILKYVEISKERYKSHLIKEELEYIIIKPKNISENEVKKLVFFLHGIRDSKGDWIEKGMLLETYVKMRKQDEIGDIAFVIPDSGYGGESWYTNFSNHKNFKYEDFYTKELIPTIKKRFSKAKMGILGYSMGGYGAYKIGLKNPDYFEVIGSMAGVLNLNRLIFRLRTLKIYRYMYIPKFLFTNFDKQHFIRVFSSYGWNVLRENPYNIVGELKKNKIENKNFYMSVGTRDNKPYWMLIQWIDFVDRVKRLNYKFKGVLYGKEGHTWDYVAKDLGTFLNYFNEVTENKTKR